MNNFFKYNVSGKTEYKLELTSDVDVISASGGQANLYTTLIKYINKKEITRITVDGEINVVGTPDDGLTIVSNNTVSASNRYTTVDDGNRHITLRATYMVGTKLIISNDLVIYQEANIATYGDVVITLSDYTYDLPASGGTFSTIDWTGSQRVTYTSGSYIDYDKNDIEIRDKTNDVVAASTGTTIKSRTYIGRKEWYFDGQGNKTTIAGVDVYQEENKITSSIFNKNVANPSTINRNGGIFHLSGLQTNTYTSKATKEVSCAPRYNDLPSWIKVTLEEDPNDILLDCWPYLDLTWDKRSWDAGYDCTVIQHSYRLVLVSERSLSSSNAVLWKEYKLYSPDKSISMPIVTNKVPLTLYISNIDRCNPDRIDRVNLSLDWDGDPFIARYQVEEGDECTDYFNAKTYVFYDRSDSSQPMYPTLGFCMLSISSGPIRTISNSGFRLTESGSLRLIR